MLILSVSGCGMIDSGPSVQQVASSYVNAFASGNDGAAAAQTDQPQVAQVALEKARRGVSATSVKASLKNVTGELHRAGPDRGGLMGRRNRAACSISPPQRW
jgi:hypothetical protein